MSEPSVDLELATANGPFTGLAWPQPGAPRVLCLHGWLDNAASFAPLAPFLDSLDLVAVDLAGHGRSRHRPKGAHYYFMDNLWDVEVMLDALEWENCSLLGHSMGGALACVFSAMAPERIDRLIVLDGLGPVSASAAMTLPRLRKSRESVRKARGKLREFPDVAAAVTARRAVAADLSEEAATLLCERSLEPHEDHFRWRTDPRLNWHSPSLLMEAQVLQILAAIKAPVLSITSDPLPRWVDEEIAQARLQVMRQCHSHSLSGHHHFHMDVPGEISPLIHDFMHRTETTDVPSQA